MEAMEVVGERNRMPRGKKKMPHSFMELVFASFHCMPLVLLARWLLLINDFSLFSCILVRCYRILVLLVDPLVGGAPVDMCLRIIW